MSWMKGALAGLALSATLALAPSAAAQTLNIMRAGDAHKRLKGARAHTLYQNVFYKGLDLSF